MADPGGAWGMRATARHRTARVYTNETCNQNCGFCDRRAPRERAAFVDARAVRRRIDEADASTLVLTGGEPTLRRDVCALVAHAKRGGARVELETNGALIDEAGARALAAAGLDLARIHLPAWGAAADAITRDPGGFAAALAGARALAAAGIALEVAAPVVRDNAELLGDLPRALRAEGVPVEALVLGVPIEAPDMQAILPLPAAARVVERVEAAARRHAIPLRLDGHTVLPPCLLENAARLAHLFALTPGGRAREGHATLAACASCAVADRCPGVPSAQAAALEGALRPIRSDRVRRRLSVISTVDEQVRRELFQDELQRRPGEPPRLARTVRVNFRCNQSCAFCFVSTHLPTAPDAEVEAAIAEAARRGATVAISGGEPTLNPRLVELVRLARDEGASLVELQTNATRIDDALAQELRDAGLGLAYVSLHALDAARSDAITGAPGTFARTLRGIDALHRAGVPLRLSYVFTRQNLEGFDAYVEGAAVRWPGVEIGVSFVAASTDLVPRTEALVPRYADVVPALAAGIARARALGVRLSGLESMCGIPLCLVPEDLAGFFALAEAPDGYDGGEIVRTAACEACDLRGRCFGLRRGYAELYGTDELQPVRRGA